jgi:eukaryotic-like serine/threonine-protein kinase
MEPSARDDDAFMRALAARVGAPLGLSADADAFAGRSVGPYRILREIGRGGMGAVYLAERADEQFEKQVAIKLLPLGLGNAGARERFDAERRILARLDHPGIARLLDGGITADGSPFFVMEYVEGVPITDYCRERALPLEQRLQLFAQVCDAVEYAHGRLVVHRDLKPGNILVSTAGEPKLLDFGIAKLEHPEAVTDPSPLTARAGLPMTLAYASPEQVRGEVVTTATDVYALGLLLFELLTGRQARQLTGNLEQDLVRVADADIPAPSSVGSATGAAARQLRGDLDTIVAMAIRREPARRYRTVAALADDIRRHLGGYPVAALPDTWRYRARKAARRHPALVGAGIVAAMGIVAFISVLSRGAQRVAAERDLAERERARAEAALGRAEQVAAVLHGLFTAADPRQALGDTLTARQLLDRGLARANELAGEPAAQAELLSVLAGVYYAAGLREEAADIAERALEVRQRHLGEEHLDAARSLYQLGTMNVPRSFGNAGLARLERAFEIQRGQLPPDDPELAQTAVALAPLLASMRSLPDSAEALLRTALATQRRLAGDSSPILVPTLGRLADVLFTAGAQSEAEGLIRWRIEIQAAQARTQLERAAVHRDRGLLLQRVPGTRAAALVELDQDLALARDVLGDHPAVVERLHNIGSLREQLGDSLGARAAFEDAVATTERLGIRTAAQLFLGWHWFRSGHPERAIALFERDTILWKQRSPTVEVPPMLRQQLGIALLHAGRAAEGLAQIRLKAEAEARHTATNPPSNYSTGAMARASGRLWLGLAASASGQTDTAAVALREAIADLAQTLRAPPDSFYTTSGTLKTFAPRTSADSANDRRARTSQRAAVEFHLGLGEAALAQLLAQRGLQDEARPLLGQGLSRMDRAVDALESVENSGAATELRLHQRALLRGVYAPPSSGRDLRAR